MPSLKEDTKLIDTNELLFYHQAIKALLADKVSRENGKSLLSDTEIARLATLVNYDDTVIAKDVADLKSKVSALEAGTFDDTQLKADIAATYVKKVDMPTSLPASDVYSWAKAATKPKYTATEVGADASGSANNALNSAKSYTDTKISDLVNGAPETLDTIGEIATAISENSSVMTAINAAIGQKANLKHSHSADDVDLSDYYNTSDIATNEDIQEILNS